MLLSGECVPDESDLTISKAIKSYKNWLEQLSRRETGALTVVLPFDVPLDPLWETQPNVTKGPIEIRPNVTISDDSPPSTTQQSKSNQTGSTTDIPIDTTMTPLTQLPNITDRYNKKADPIHLPIISDVVTDSPPFPPTIPITFQSIRTTVRPSFIVEEDDRDHNSPLSNSFPIMRRRPLPTTKKPISRASTSRGPPMTIFPARKRPTAQVSSDNPDEIPWLILKSPPAASDPPLSEMYRIPSTATPGPFIPNHQEEIQQRRPVIRRPLVRFPSTTVRPTPSSSMTSDPDIPWVILKSPQKNKGSSTTLVNPPKKPAAKVPTVKSRIPPAAAAAAADKVPIVDDQGIPWLILKSPDPHPSDSSESPEIYYPNIPSNERNKRQRKPFPGYFISTT